MTDLPKLAAPARRALAAAGIAKLEDLRRFGEAEIAALHGMGPNAMASLAAALKTARLGYRRS
jgi:hypothetical protein